MSTRCEWEDYKGNKILLVDYSNLKDQAYRDAITEVTEWILELPDTELLEVVDFTGCYLDMTTFQLLKEAVGKTKVKVKKTAVLGVTGVKKNLMEMLLKASGRTNVRPFNEVGIAKEWLIS